MIQDIRIEPWPPSRGRRRILVDGVEWGSIHMEAHGCHGPSITSSRTVGPAVI